MSQTCQNLIHYYQELERVVDRRPFPLLPCLPCICTPQSLACGYLPFWMLPAFAGQAFEPLYFDLVLLTVADNNWEGANLETLCNMLEREGIPLEGDAGEAMAELCPIGNDSPTRRLAVRAARRAMHRWLEDSSTTLQEPPDSAEP